MLTVRGRRRSSTLAGTPVQVPKAPLPLLLLIASLRILGACGEDPPKGPAAIEIGTGTTAYEPLIKGQELGLVAGIQGGYHFVINARMQNLLPGDPSMPNALGNPQTRFSVYLEDGSRVDNTAPPYRLGYRAEMDDWFEMPSGRILQLDDDLIADDDLLDKIFEQETRLVVEVRDARGDEATHEATVVAVPGEGF
ncbi:MAG: hypothetical protein GY811_14950 [Myxococcales bacterium]|nr:hypothetical protein [Myxococcales bacterium]